MSEERATEFIQRASEDQDLYDRVVDAAGQPTSGDEQNYESVVALGKAEGYDFTVEELRKAFKEYQYALRLKSRDLNDVELEAVAGGGKALAPATGGPKI
jgi:predicted ribosomally synthesized peptide with nif11-like leader